MDHKPLFLEFNQELQRILLFFQWKTSLVFLSETKMYKEEIDSKKSSVNGHDTNNRVTLVS